ncbi:MAG: tetratricopeptide repeat protein [Pseudomonadota bacterium]
MTWYDLGVYAYENKNYDTARKYFTKSLEYNQENDYCFHYLGKLYFSSGLYHDAKQWLEKAWTANKTIPGLAFDLAMLYFKMAAYQPSFELFDGIVSENPHAALARYYAGMCRYRQQDFSSALLYLLSAADQNPSIKPSSFYYAGLCYKGLNRFDLAREKFDYVRNNAPSSLLIGHATRQLSLLQKKEKPEKPYSLSVRSGFGYDDNVALAPDETEFYANEGDTFADVYLSGNYNLINQGPYRLGAGLSHYESMYTDLDEYDISATAITVRGSFFFGQFGLGLNYTPSFYSLDKDSYLTRHTIGATAVCTITKGFLASLAYDCTDNSYDGHKLKNSRAQEGTLGLYYALSGMMTGLSGRIGYENNAATGADYSFSRIKTQIKVSFKIPWDLTCDITGNYQKKTYDSDDSYYEKKREDTWLSGEISISKPIFFDWMSVEAEFRHEDNDSTIKPFVYQKNVSALFLEARF